MKTAISIALASFAVSVCAWAQTPNLAALHSDTEKAYLARDLVRAAGLAESLSAAASQMHDPKEMGFAELMTGRVFNATGDYSQALNSLERALQIYRDANESAGIATVFNDQAVAYRYTGKLALAFDLIEQARAIFEKANDKAGLAHTYLELGNTYIDADNYRSALDALQHSLRLAEEAGLPRVIANANNSIGNVYNHQGNRELALEFYQRSLEIKERVSNYYEIINTLVNMASAYVPSGRLGDAQKQLDRALELARPDDPRSRAQVLNRYGRLLFVEEKYDEALARLNETMELLSGGQDEGLKGDTLVRIARIQAEKDQFDEALKTANEAVDVAVRAQSLIIESLALEVRGVAAYELHRDEEALATFTRMIDIDEELRANVAGDAAQVQTYLRGEGDVMHGVVELLIRLRRNEEAFQMTERNKGRVLLTVLGEEDARLTNHLTIDERSRETALKQILVDANLQLQQAQRAPAQAPRLKELQSFVEKARLELAAFESSLYAAHPELQVHRNDTPAVSAEQAAQLLPDSRTLLLEYDLGPDHSYLFTVARSESGTAIFSVHELKAKTKDLASRVNSFRRSIAQRDLGYRDEAKKLYELLLAPAAAELAGKDTIVIVPDGALWQLPFQALETPTSEAVIEKHAVFFAPSMTVLSRMKIRPAESAQRMTLLAVGDATVGLELPGLKDIYGVRESRVITGPQATENTVKAAASQYRVVHLSTHGFYDDKHPMNSYLQLARPNDSNTEDGKLEAREMMTLDLNADLVILSACETARGDTKGGEGLVGMTWALLVAGVPTAVASQWKVDSASTADLMVRFHKSLSSQLSKSSKLAAKAKTLQQAVLGLMKNPQYRHPFYWASFVMVGQGF